MKKLFFYLPVILFLISISMSVYTAEVARAMGMVSSDNFRLEWRVTEGQQQENFIIPSLSSQGQERSIPAARISPDGRVLFQQNSGSVIRDRLGKIRPQMNKSTRQAFEESLDEDVKEGADRLRAGESITLSLNESTEIVVTCDSKIKLISKEGDEYPVSLSRFDGSIFISLATSKRWRKEGDRNIKLEIAGERLKTLCNFLSLDKEGRKKLVGDLPVVGSIYLMQDLDFFQFSEKEYLQIFVSKIFCLLKGGGFTRLKEVSSKKEVQPIIEKILRRVMPPVPKVLFKIAKASNMVFSPDSRKLAISRGDNGGEIRDLGTGKIDYIGGCVRNMVFSPDFRWLAISRGDNGGEIRDLKTGKIDYIKGRVEGMVFSPDFRWLAISRGDNGGEIRDLKTGKIDYIKGPIWKMSFSPDFKKLAINRGVGGVKIRDLETGKIDYIKGFILEMSFSPDSRRLAISGVNRVEIRDLETGKTGCIEGEGFILEMSFSPDSRKLAISKKGYKGEIMNFEDNRGIEFTELKPDQLRFVFNLVHTPNYLAQVDRNEATRIWRSINPEIQKILKREYFPQIDFSSLEGE